MTVRWGFIGASTIAREQMPNAVRARGEDGVWSLATALAFAEAARSGEAVLVEPGLTRP